MFIRKIFAILILLISLFLSNTVSATNRKGLFGRAGFGFGRYTSTQTWEYETREGGVIWEEKDIDRGKVKNVVSEFYPSLNIGVGIGLTNRILFAFDLQLSEISIGGLNFTAFYSESAPSLFADITFPFATSGTIKFRHDHSENFMGHGYSIGLGYEFTKSVCVRVGFNRTSHYYESIYSPNSEVILVTFFLVSAESTEYVGRANSYSFDVSLVFLAY